jgi:cytidine deaminase
VIDDAGLHELARGAAALAHAPYSGYRVGAAVLTRDGRTLTAANVENGSYGLSLCAERAALARAVAEGAGPGAVEAVAVTAAPCGACRQWLLEFGVDRVLYPRGGMLVTRRPEDLLPDAFRLAE